MEEGEERRGGEEHTFTHAHARKHTKRETKNIKRQSGAQGTERRLQQEVQTGKKKKEMEARICSVAEVRQEEDLMTMNDDEEEEEKESYEQGES